MNSDRQYKGSCPLYSLGSAEEHARAGRFGEAEKICQRVLRERPRDPGTMVLYSILARQRGEFAVAVDRAAKAAEAHPEIAEIHANLGEFSRLAGKMEQSIASFELAIRLKPLEPTFHNSLATVFCEIRRHESAVKEYERAVQLKPDYAQAWSNLGAVLRELGRLDEAAEAIGTALRFEPQLAGAHLNLAIVRTDQERFGEAFESYGRAIAIQPDFREAHWSLGMLHLLLGNTERGWPEYQWRPTLAPRFAKPIWKGEDLSGKTILLHTEQGLGDTIQFARYIPMLAEKGARTVLACQQPLTRLLSGFAPILSVGQPFPVYDFHCPLLNLPMVFGTNPGNIPAHIPYLKANDDLSKDWKRRLGDKGAKKRVGLVWAGRPQHRDDSRRSISFEQLAILLQMPGVDFFSLQMGPPAKQAAGSPIIDLTAELHDFCDTAALIENLDLVITVDTAVAHLAGAMGKPVWVLLARIPDWRWMLERADSPWYPTMRLYRQKRRGDWATVVAEIAHCLKGD